MASTKTEKVDAEIVKVKAKIAEFQGRLRELEQKKTELENTEIVGMVRNLNVGMDDLAALMQMIRDQKLVDNLSRPEPEPVPEPEAPAASVQYNGDAASTFVQDEARPNRW